MDRPERIRRFHYGIFWIPVSRNCRCHAELVSQSGQPQKKESDAGQAGNDVSGQAPGYDQRRARARLALIEQQVTLAEALGELEEADACPAPEPGARDQWEQWRAQAVRAATSARHWISQLAPLVGDPETVADEYGRLPASAARTPSRVRRQNQRGSRRAGREAAHAARPVEESAGTAGARCGPPGPEPGRHPADLPAGAPPVYCRRDVL